LIFYADHFHRKFLIVGVGSVEIAVCRKIIQSRARKFLVRGLAAWWQ